MTFQSRMRALRPRPLFGSARLFRSGKWRIQLQRPGGLGGSRSFLSGIGCGCISCRLQPAIAITKPARMRTINDLFMEHLLYLGLLVDSISFFLAAAPGAGSIYHFLTDVIGNEL